MGNDGKPLTQGMQAGRKNNSEEDGGFGNGEGWWEDPQGTMETAVPNFFSLAVWGCGHLLRLDRDCLG